MRIQIRTCDDWVAVYKDGRKVWDNHSCPLAEGLEALGIPFESVDLDDQMDDIGNMSDGSDPFPGDAAMKERDDIDPASTWIVSDTHFGHENIKAYCHRPQDVEQIMMEEWARAVGPKDTLLHLGDLSYKGNAWFKNMIAPHLTGVKLLVRGNHDRSSSGFYRQSGFKLIAPFFITHNGLRVEFSHYPVNGEIHPKTWRIHGHIHNNGYERDRFVPYLRNHVNVSAEMMKYKPVRLDALLEVLP